MQNWFNTDEKDPKQITNDSTNDVAEENDIAFALSRTNLTEEELQTTNQFNNSDEYNYQNSSDVNYHSKYNRLNQISSIKTAGIFSVVGIFLFILPGIIAAIIAIVKLATFNSSEATAGLKTAAIVFLILTVFIGGILTIVFANKESAILQRRR